MPEKSSSWVRVLLGRIVSYAILGGLTMAFVGALLISTSGALVGAVLDVGSAGPISGPTGEIMALWGARFGAVFGGMGGGIAGLILFGIVGFGSAARRSFLPPKAILGSAVIGMSAATLGVMTSFFVGCALLAFMRGDAFDNTVNDGVMFILFGAPAVMVCGEIAGTIWAFRREKEARDA